MQTCMIKNRCINPSRFEDCADDFCNLLTMNEYFTIFIQSLILNLIQDLFWGNLGTYFGQDDKGD
jgi:hypothetical protein